jgi:hypothetical protein
MGLVHHQPHAGEADELVVVAGHDVVRQAVGFELGAIGVRRPGRGKALALDLLDGAQIVDRHAVDDDG